MKRIFITAVLAIGTIIGSQAQEISDNAIGLRLNPYYVGAEISYQMKLSEKNRIEADLAIQNRTFTPNYYSQHIENNTFIGITGIYQWIFPIKNGFYWYAGPSGGIGINSNSGYRHPDRTNNSTSLLIGGNAGIEYNFDIPLQLSADIRPQFDIINSGYFPYNDIIAISARYKF